MEMQSSRQPSGQQNQALDSEPIYEVAADDQLAKRIPNTQKDRDLSTRNYDNKDPSSYQYLDIVPETELNGNGEITSNTKNDGVYQALGDRNEYEGFSKPAVHTKEKEVDKVHNRRCRENALLVTVLIVSSLALLLVILNIAGIIGYKCSCTVNKGVHSELAKLRNSYNRLMVDQNILNAKIDRVSSYNRTIVKGEKGDKGDTGATGAVGPSGAGNLTQCVVKFKSSAGTSPLGDTAKQEIEVIEETPYYIIVPLH
ncbi:hypothetical protein AC249_AIPGENE20935 [Exaiptasia diaphana]|nr:hypothetical protein AC249_AIPGENE20935 [Exaiptasia diaphana]